MSNHARRYARCAPLLTFAAASLALAASACVADEPAGTRGVAESTAGLGAANVAPDVFDWRFYLNANPDLMQAGLVSAADAQQHWVTRGIAECRRAHPWFHTRQYLDRYPDLQAALGSDCTAALQHYLDHGRNEGREGLLGQDYGGRTTTRNRLITIGTSFRTGGAIDSLYWNGREFINSYDHGRQLQVAWSGNGLGECYNPTEAGGEYDALKTTSTSQLLGWKAVGNVLMTTSRPAFWLLPGQDSHASACGGARNASPVSDYLLHKRVEVGFAGIEYVAEFQTQVDIPEPLSGLTIEAPAAYLGGEFSSFYTWDPATCALAPLGGPNGEQGLPVVLSTPDGSAAMGAWSPDLPSADFPGSGYGRFAYPAPGNDAASSNKLNVVSRRGPTPPGSYHYRTYIGVGSLENVRVALCQAKAAVH